MVGHVTQHRRDVRVRCDECDLVVKIQVHAPTPKTEDQWDRLVVEELIRRGWRAGQEPSAHHQRAPRDICPKCRT